MRAYPWNVPGYGHGLTTHPLRTAAERFLDNYDTVEAMFDEIRADPDPTWSCRMLIHLMMTTKSFHHHAATIIWSSLGELGILPLLDIIKGFHIPTLRDGTRYVNSIHSSPTSYSIASASFPCPPSAFPFSRAPAGEGSYTTLHSSKMFVYRPGTSPR